MLSTSVLLALLQLMISFNVAVKAHLSEVVWDKTVNKKIKDKCFGSFGMSGPLQVCKLLIINGELLGSVIIDALLLNRLQERISGNMITKL